jgi:hypothetical protein
VQAADAFGRARGATFNEKLKNLSTWASGIVEPPTRSSGLALKVFLHSTQRNGWLPFRFVPSRWASFLQVGHVNNIVQQAVRVANALDKRVGAK